MAEEDIEKFKIEKDEILWVEVRKWIPLILELKKEILLRTYKLKYVVYLGSTKIDQDLHQCIWWPGIKKERLGNTWVSVLLIR